MVTEILKHDMSINLYMFHGGTNFGFMNGAFAVGIPSPKPMVTSYGMCDRSVFSFMDKSQDCFNTAICILCHLNKKFL